MPTTQTGRQPTTRGQDSLGGPHTDITASGKATGSAWVVPVVPNSGPGRCSGGPPACVCLWPCTCGRREGWSVRGEKLKVVLST